MREKGKRRRQGLSPAGRAVSRRWLAGAALALWLLAGCQADAASSSSLGENQTELYGKIIDIAGNEMTVSLGAVQQAGGPSGLRGKAAGGSDREDASSGEDASGAGGPGGAGQGTRPEGMGGSGRGDGGLPPEGAPGDWGAAGGSQGSDDLPDLPQAEGAPEDLEGEGGQPQSRMQFVDSGEQASYTIPVSTPVVRGSGENQTKANFTMLSIDMVVRMVLEEGVVVSIEVTSY